MNIKINPINISEGFINRKLQHSQYRHNTLNVIPYLTFKGISDKNIYMANIALRDKKASVIFNKLISEFAQLEEVEAIALGGSRKTSLSDNTSDIDIEIYTSGEIPVQKRVEIIKKYSSKYDAGQDYFGADDEFYADELAQDIDIAYFDKSWMDSVVDNVWNKHQASNGYTTCFLHTIKQSKLLYDKDGWLKAKKEQLDTPYPKELRENIIKRNMMLMKDKPFASYYEQIKKALSRNDYNSVNHRLSAFMESYFDVIFAMNEILHPGEKKLVQFAKKNCKILPCDFEENINRLMIHPTEHTLLILDDMIDKLRECL